MSELVLYMYPGKDDLPSPSPPCTKILMALKYSHLPHQVELVKGDPRGVSPTGRLPALVLDGEAISDSVEILDRLERRGLPRRISPEDRREWARDRVWEKFANEHFYWRAVYLRWVVPENCRRTVKGLLPRLPPPLGWILPVVARRQARGRAVGQGIGLQPLERVRSDVLQAFDTWEAGIGAGPFLEERSEPGRGDLGAAANLCQLPYLGLTPWAGEELLKRPALVDYTARVFEACELPLPACMKM